MINFKKMALENSMIGLDNVPVLPVSRETIPASQHMVNMGTELTFTEKQRLEQLISGRERKK
ncbi:MAG: hypothetical protein AAB656_03320 [Patescibacteria group bacterium]